MAKVELSRNLIKNLVDRAADDIRKSGNDTLTKEETSKLIAESIYFVMNNLTNQINK
jgi:hypothetical protein